MSFPGWFDVETHPQGVFDPSANWQGRYDDEFVRRISAAAASNPAIAIRYGQAVLSGPAAHVVGQFQRVVPFPSVAPASPVVGVRYGRAELLSQQAFVAARFGRFPYFEQPAQPPVPFRYGQLDLGGPEAFVAARFTPFPFRSEAAAPAANPLVAFRYGRNVLADTLSQPWVSPTFLAFGTVGDDPANPPIAQRVGQLPLVPPAAFVAPKYQRFPLFQAPAAANPVIGLRHGRAELLLPGAFVAPSFQRFPFFAPPAPASPVIGLRYGQAQLLRPEAFVAARFSPFPYWIEFIPPPPGDLLQFRYDP